MSRIRQSVCFSNFLRDGLSATALIEAATDIGYASIEMLPEEHWQQVQDCGLDIACVVGHASLPDGLNKRENHDRIEAELRARIEAAAAWGIKSLIVFSGNRESRSEQEGRDNCVEGLLRVKDAAESAGVTLCMELLNSKVDHSDYQCDRTPWGVEVCHAVDSGHVRLLYDIYHMQIMEGDLIRTIDTYGQWFGHYHTAGNPGRQDLDLEQEIYYPPVMAAIQRSDYEGFVGHEFRPKADPVEALRAAFNLCDVGDSP
jgi:hydroxypyruvate isomerase